MESSFKYGPSNLFLTSIWVSLPSDPEVYIYITPLTHSKIHKIQELQYFKSKHPTIFDPSTIQLLLSEHIADTKNVIGFSDTYSFVSQLPLSDVRFLYMELMTISVVTSEQLEELTTMLDIQFNPVFQDETWDCRNCQEKKLDYSRGCGFLKETERDLNPLLPRINGVRYTQCPISSIEAFTANQASKAHTMLINGVLPESGGIGDQTDWFVKAALLFKRKVAEAERAAYEERKNK